MTLIVDGHPMPTAVLGKPIPLNPGRHTLVVTAPEHAAFTTQVSLNETDAVVANALLTPLPKRPVVSALKPSPAPVVASPPPIPDVATSTGLHTRTYVLIGEAAVALSAVGVGIGYTLRASSEDERVEWFKQQLKSDSACNAQPVSQLCADLQRVASDAKRDHLIARIGFIAAGAAAASFVGTLILWRPPAKVAIIPSFAPGAAELWVATHF